MKNKFLFFIFLQSTVTQNLDLPGCVKECLKPLMKIQKTNVDVYFNYDEICDRLEPAASCAQKCGHENHVIFHQVTTNFRIHCVDFAEELEDHIECLSRNAITAESYCNKDCKIDPTSNNQVSACKRSECISVCLVRKLTHSCPRAETVLKKISVKRAKELEIAKSHQDFGKLPPECQNLHDPVRVERILEDL